jgi:hypothetical protein
MTLDGPSAAGFPKQLQRKIWHHTLPDSRIIQVHRLADSTFLFNGAGPLPALYTCKTSREIALSVFEPAFSHMDTNTSITSTTDLH